MSITCYCCRIIGQIDFDLLLYFDVTRPEKKEKKRKVYAHFLVQIAITRSFSKLGT